MPWRARWHWRQLAAAAAGAAGSGAPGAPDGLLEVFDEQLAAGARWSLDPLPEDSLRGDGAFSGSNWLFLRARDAPLSLTGLSIPVREHPGPGEARYLSFAWRMWHTGRIALQLDRDPAQDGGRQPGKLHGYRFDAGEGPPVGERALRVSDSISGTWQTVASDLWKDFGDFTITGLTFTVTERGQAGFDAIHLARDPAAFQTRAPLLQASVVDPVEPGEEPAAPAAPAEAVPAAGGAPRVDIDWGAQFRAGGWMMYPLYLAGLAAVVIAVQRLLTSRPHRLAPEPLLAAVRELVPRGEIAAALAACDRHPSTLAEAVRFVLRHRHAGMEVVSRSAGDIAARDIRGHLAGIYPLSVIASLSPLLGLLGTIIGMIEAFGLVSLYGDEGGATILSDSISKALITTAAGLIIAAPCIAVYHLIRNRITRLASVIEVEVEELVNNLYLRQPGPPPPGAAGA